MPDNQPDNAVTLDGLAGSVRDLAGTVTEGFEAQERVTAEAATTSEQRIKSVEEELASVKASMESVRVDMPGAEDVKINGRNVCMGDFIVAARMCTVEGRSRTDAAFPELAEIDTQCRKVISGQTEERMWGGDNLRIMSTGVDSAGGYLVPEQVSSQFIDNAYARTALAGVSATSINGLQGSPFSAHRLTTNPVAYMVGENVAATESTPAFSKEQFTPRKVAVLWGQAREAQIMTSPNAGAIAQNAAERVLALKIDKQALEGDGSVQYEVNGLRNQSGVVDTDFSAYPDNPSADRDLRGIHMVRLRQIVEELNAEMDSFGVITHTKAKNILALEGVNVGGADGPQDTPGDWSPLMGRWLATDEQLRAAYGPIGHSTNLASNLGGGNACNTFAGPWSLFWSCFWGGLFIQTSNVVVVGSQNAWEDDLVFTRMIQLFDAGAVAPERFTFSNEFNTVRAGN